MDEDKGKANTRTRKRIYTRKTTTRKWRGTNTERDREIAERDESEKRSKKKSRNVLCHVC